MAGATLKNLADSQNEWPGVTSGFETPVALFNFNRPQMTRQVFEVVRKIRPRRLLLVADGPRMSRPEDAILCAEVRAIFDEIDWECEVSRNFSDTNLGSFKRNSTGLNWVFDTVEEAIILEDDCIPSLSFFPYCEELLERYRNDPGVGLICGSNFGISGTDGKNDSYFFSAYNFTWGWATWRRIWQQVDLTMSWWQPEEGKEMLRKLFPRPAEWKHWYRHFEAIRSSKRKNAWDYQLLLSCFRHSQCGVIPRVSMISNIGFGADATHFNNEPSHLQNCPRGELEFPLVHPAEVLRSGSVDSAIYHLFGRPVMWQRAINKLGRIFRRLKKTPK